MQITDRVVIAGDDDCHVRRLQEEASGDALVEVVLQVQPVERESGGLDERRGAEDLGDLRRTGRLLRHGARVLHELRRRLQPGARRTRRRAAPRGALLDARLCRLCRGGRLSCEHRLARLLRLLSGARVLNRNYNYK